MNNLITIKNLDNLRRMSRENDELFGSPSLVQLNGHPWVMGTDRYSILALNPKYFDITVSEQTKDLQPCNTFAIVRIKQLLDNRTNSTELMVDRTRLDRWTSPFYDSRSDLVDIKPGLIRGVTIHRGLLAKLLMDLPGQQITIGPGRIKNTDYIWLMTSYWRAALACFSDIRTKPDVFEEMD